MLVLSCSWAVLPCGSELEWRVFWVRWCLLWTMSEGSLRPLGTITAQKHWWVNSFLCSSTSKSKFVLWISPHWHRPFTQPIVICGVFGAHEPEFSYFAAFFSLAHRRFVFQLVNSFQRFSVADSHCLNRITALQRRHLSLIFRSVFISVSSASDRYYLFVSWCRLMFQDPPRFPRVFSWRVGWVFVPRRSVVFLVSLWSAGIGAEILILHDRIAGRVFVFAGTCLLCSLQQYRVHSRGFATP